MDESRIYGTPTARDAARPKSPTQDPSHSSAARTPTTPGSAVRERLSPGADERPAFVVAIFAHNEAARVRAAIECLASAANGTALDVVVLANGCTDATAQEVRACAASVPNLSLVEIALADKANAWNVLIHDAISPEQADRLEACFCMDGDVTLLPNALSLLASALQDVPSAYAAGAMPAMGRDRNAWRQRMITYGNLSGNLYALRGSFVRRIRERQIRLPIGLIGEDFLVSWLVATDLGTRSAPTDEPMCVFHSRALFAFRSTSRWKAGDYVRYLRRKWRYTWRGLQLQMLIGYLRTHGLKAMPTNVQRLYRDAALPSRLVWAGWDTPMRLLAIMWIRLLRKRLTH